IDKFDAGADESAFVPRPQSGHLTINFFEEIAHGRFIRNIEIQRRLAGGIPQLRVKLHTNLHQNQWACAISSLRNTPTKGRLRYCSIKSSPYPTTNSSS